MFGHPTCPLAVVGLGFVLDPPLLFFLGLELALAALFPSSSSLSDESVSSLHYPRARVAGWLAVASILLVGFFRRILAGFVGRLLVAGLCVAGVFGHLLFGNESDIGRFLLVSGRSLGVGEVPVEHLGGGWDPLRATVTCHECEGLNEDEIEAQKRRNLDEGSRRKLSTRKRESKCPCQSAYL